MSEENQACIDKFYDGLVNKSRDDFMSDLSQDELYTIIYCYKDKKGNQLIQQVPDLKALSNSDFIDAVNSAINHYAYRDITKERGDYLDIVQQTSDLELYAVDYSFKYFYVPSNRVPFNEFIKKQKEQRGKEFYKSLANDVVLNYNNMVSILSIPKDEGGRGLKWSGKQFLSPIQAARIISVVETIRMVCTKYTIASPIASPIASGIVTYYVEHGDNEGVSETIGKGIVDIWTEQLVGAAKLNWKNEFYEKIVAIASRRENRVLENRDVDLIAMNNCIFNFKTKERLPFSSDYVTLRKHAVSLPESLPDMPTHTMENGSVLTAEDFLNKFVPYDGGSEILFKVIGACLRSKFNWRNMITLVNVSGNNGKSTFLGLLQAIIGADGTMSSSLAKLAGEGEGGRFALANLPGKSLITCEDSNSSEYIKNNSRLKSLISHDPVAIEGKGKEVFDYEPQSIIVCAANNLPKTKDKGRAWLDRNIFIAFSGEFRGEDDDKYVRDVWSKTKEVCEYFTYKALMELEYYDTIPESELSLALKAEFMEENDPIVEFYNDCIESSPYDFIPMDTLWAGYQEWMNENRPNTKLPSKIAFTKSIYETISRDGKWMQPSSSMRFSTWVELKEERRDGYSFGHYMWVGDYQAYTKLKNKYRGIVKIKIYDYCQKHGTNPKELKEQGRYEQVCEDLGLGYIEK